MKQQHNILIVDDDADDREILRDAFLSDGSSIEQVFLENGERLMEYLEQYGTVKTPSLIVLDLNMPGKDGRESIRDIKSDGRFQHIPIIVMTTSSSVRDRQMSYDLGANCFITKPDTFNKLLDITSAIRRLWLG